MPGGSISHRVSVWYGMRHRTCVDLRLTIHPVARDVGRGKWWADSEESDDRHGAWIEGHRCERSGALCWYGVYVYDIMRSR